MFVTRLDFSIYFFFNVSRSVAGEETFGCVCVFLLWVCVWHIFSSVCVWHIFSSSRYVGSVLAWLRNCILIIITSWRKEDLSEAVAHITPLQIPQHGGVRRQNFLAGSFALDSFLVAEGCIMRDLGVTAQIITGRSPNWLSVPLLRGNKLITIFHWQMSNHHRTVNSFSIQHSGRKYLLK